MNSKAKRKVSCELLRALKAYFRDSGSVKNNRSQN